MPNGPNLHLEKACLPVPFSHPISGTRVYFYILRGFMLINMSAFIMQILGIWNDFNHWVTCFQVMIIFILWLFWISVHFLWWDLGLLPVRCVRQCVGTVGSCVVYICKLSKWSPWGPGSHPCSAPARNGFHRDPSYEWLKSEWNPRCGNSSDWF